MHTRLMGKARMLLIGALIGMNSPVQSQEEPGIIGRVYENGLPVIYKFVNALPPDEVRRALQWLTVISWKYDGSNHNGMPPADENQRMIVLEDTIENEIDNPSLLRHVYSRTGNGLKEFVYYVHERDQFLERLNNALAGHARYPIEINFYEDTQWEDFRRLLDDFADAAAQ